MLLHDEVEHRLKWHSRGLNAENRALSLSEELKECKLRPAQGETERRVNETPFLCVSFTYKEAYFLNIALNLCRTKILDYQTTAHGIPAMRNKKQTTSLFMLCPW